MITDIFSLKKKYSFEITVMGWQSTYQEKRVFLPGMLAGTETIKQVV